MELSPDVIPTCRFDDFTFFIQPIESSVSIRLKRAMEGSEMHGWMFRFAIGRISEPDGRRLRAAHWPIITHICPQTSRLRFAIARSQHWNRNVIAVQLRRIQHVFSDRPDERLQCSADAADPVG